MSKAKYCQLTFAFGVSPRGDGPAKLSDVSVGKVWRSLKAKVKEANDSVACTVDASRPLESVASVSTLAQAILNVARNKGVAGVDGRSVDDVVGETSRLLPCLRRELLAGTYLPGDIRRVWISKPGGVFARIRFLSPASVELFDDDTHLFRRQPVIPQIKQSDLDPCIS